MPAPHAACGGLCGPVCGAGMLETAPLPPADRKLSARLRFNIAKVPTPNHKTIPRIVKPASFIVSLDRPRSSGCLNQLHPSRTAAFLLAAWWEGRARRDVFRCRSLSLVRIHCCRLVPPDLCGFPDGSPQRDEGKTPGKSARAFAGGRSRGRVPTRRRKCTQVGRVARRARPVMWRHIGTVRLVENRCPALP